MSFTGSPSALHKKLVMLGLSGLETLYLELGGVATASNIPSWWSNMQSFCDPRLDHFTRNSVQAISLACTHYVAEAQKLETSFWPVLQRILLQEWPDEFQEFGRTTTAVVETTLTVIVAPKVVYDSLVQALTKFCENEDETAEMTCVNVPGDNNTYTVLKIIENASNTRYVLTANESQQPHRKLALRWKPTHYFYFDLQEKKVNRKSKTFFINRVADSNETRIRFGKPQMLFFGPPASNCPTNLFGDWASSWIRIYPTEDHNHATQLIRKYSCYGACVVPDVFRFSWRSPNFCKHNDIHNFGMAMRSTGTFGMAVSLPLKSKEIDQTILARSTGLLLSFLLTMAEEKHFLAEPWRCKDESIVSSIANLDIPPLEALENPRAPAI